MLTRFSSKILRNCCNKSSFSTLIVAEHNNKALSDPTFSAIKAATKLSSKDVSILIAGKNCESVAKQASEINEISKVLYCDNNIYENILPENLSKLVVECQNNNNYKHILGGVSSMSRDLLPRIAGELNISQISDIIDVIDDDTFVRPMYAGNAISKIKSNESLKIITVRCTSFQYKPTNNSNNAEIISIDACEAFPGKEFIGNELSENKGPTLTAASVVISGGRGLQNGDNFKLLYDLADNIDDCAVGASRAAVDAGFVSNDLQVGQTGKVVAPNCYMAIGISGAIQHIAGMKDSKLIMAINKDNEAPIFSIADYGLVSDLFDAVPQLNDMIKTQKK